MGEKRGGDFSKIKKGPQKRRAKVVEKSFGEKIIEGR